MLARRSFTVNLLHDGARRTAARFAGGDDDRFTETPWSLPSEAAGPHLTDDAHSIADCVVDQVESVGDHAVVFGRVVAVVAQPGRPLVYGLRRYLGWPRESGQ